MSQNISVRRKIVANVERVRKTEPLTSSLHQQPDSFFYLLCLEIPTYSICLCTMLTFFLRCVFHSFPYSPLFSLFKMSWKTLRNLFFYTIRKTWTLSNSSSLTCTLSYSRKSKSQVSTRKETIIFNCLGKRQIFSVLVCRGELIVIKRRRII